LQPRPNNDLHKFPSERGKGIAGTVIIHLVLLLLLVFVGFSVPPPPEIEEGIEVNFGTGETGTGLIEPSPPAFQEESFVQPTASTAEVTEDEPLLTQDTEEAPEVKKVDPDAERKKLEKIEADKKRREEIEAERIKKAAEEAERKRIEAEQQRQTDIMNRTKNALANSKNAGTSTTSEGITGGTGNQGVANGSADSQVRGDGGGTGNSGISYDLQGRGFQKLPPPKYDYQGEGRVVVEVSVDRTGKVIQATPGTKGSTTLDEYLLKVAKDAALEARFEAKPDAPVVQKGTITYNFILK
jgi:outer membrane biosynthesis protein TonB